MTVMIERVGSLTTALGECPRWDGARLWLMDCRKGLILTLDATGRAEIRAELPPPAGSFALRQGGGLVVALKEEVVLVDADGTRRSVGRIDGSHPNLRLNDGVALPDGSFLVGTMHIFREPGEAPLGGIYRLGPDLTFTRIGPAVGVTNGPCVSPLDGRLHLCDSAARVIHSYALTSDGLTDQRIFATTELLASAPDGCCFDSDGGLWTALVHAGAVVRFGPDGEVDQRIDLPLRHPAAVCFGGSDLGDLYVTSISDSGRLKADGPLDGAVLRITGHGRSGLPGDLFGPKSRS